MATNAARIEPLEGRRDNLSIRVIVAGTPDYHRPIASALVSDAVSLVDLAETEEELFDKLRREEFDCLIADQTFGGRSTLELHQKVDKHFAACPAMVLLTDAPDQKTILKAFRNGVSDVVVTGPTMKAELSGAVRRSVERSRKMRNLMDEIEYLSKLARYDRLTGVPNRNFLEDRLASLVAGARRHDGGFAVLSIDVNNFEAINEIYGYAIGDQVLKAFARQLMQASRSSDAFGRLTDNEFLYLIDREITAESIEQACARLSQALAFTVELESIAIALTASIGAALYPSDGGDIDQLLTAARQAKQVAKAAGGGYHVPHSVQITIETLAADGARDAADAKREAERDANRRIEHRERVLRRGRLVLGDGFSTLDCIIRDISAHGARFTVQEGIAVPRTLSLTILDTGRSHPAIRRWQRGASIGVEFTNDAAQEQGDKAA